MIQVRTIERTQLFAGIGIKLVDDHTGGPPIRSVRAMLDASDGAGGFRRTDIRAVIGADGTLTYPWLERRRNAAAFGPQTYRVRLESDVYVPFYRASSDGIVVTVHPYDDDTAPANVPKVPTLHVLLPSSDYPFEPETPVVRGTVVDAAGAPVRDALVVGGTERTLTGLLGDFALSLRWSPNNTPIAIDASDRHARTGSITIQLPSALVGNQRITVN